MSYRMRKVLAFLFAAEFVFMGILPFVAEQGNVFADVGSIADGEDITYDKRGGVLRSMGFDTSKMPDTYDPDATTNPYGSDVATLKEVDETLLFDISRNSSPNNTTLFGHNNKLNGDYDNFYDSKVKKEISSEFLKKDDFVNAVKCDITGDGRDSAVAVVYTHFNHKSHPSTSDDNTIYMCIYDPVTGRRSDSFEIGELSSSIAAYNYQVQSQLQITAGDFDKDSVDEIAVYSPTDKTGARNKVMVYDLTDGKECQDPYSIHSWRHSWNYILPYNSEKIVRVLLSGDMEAFSNAYNNIDLTSGDADNDGIDDLIVSYGASDTDYWNKKKGAEQTIRRSIPSRSVLLYGSDTGQMLRDSQNISFGGQELIRVSFAFGDVDEDGNEDMFVSGQLMSEQDDNTSRVIGRYIYDSDSEEMELESLQNMYVVNGSMTDEDGDGEEDTFNSSNGWDEHYYSAPLMKTNLAVGNISGSADDVRIYLDSVLYTYDGGEFAIADELEDDSVDDKGNLKGSGVFAGDKAIKRKDDHKVCAYYEFGAACANFTASVSDPIIVNRVSTRRNSGMTYSEYTDADIETTSSMLVYDGQDITRRDPINDPGVYSGITAHSQFAGAPTLIMPADTDRDGLIAEYTGEHDIQYQDPAVLAVLASPPYFKDVAAYDENDMLVYLTTDYGTSSGSSHGREWNFSSNFGAFLNTEHGTSVSHGIANVSTGWAREETWGWEKEREFEMSYGTEGGEDAVVMYSIPTENYIYKVRGVTVDDDGNYEEFTNTLTVTKPHKPVTQTLALEDYEEIQKRYSDKLPDISKYLTSTPGYPATYPKNKDDLSDEAKAHIDWDTEHPVDYGEKWAGTAFGDGSITQTLSYSKETRDRYDNHLDGAFFETELGWAWETKNLFWFHAVEVGATFSFDQVWGDVAASIEGADCSGTIKNMPRSAKGYGYGFSWKLFKYNIKDKNCTFPVITYMVDDVTAPPELPDTIEQDFEKSSDSEIVLTWNYSHGNPQAFDIYRYEDFPIGGGDKLIGTVAGGDFKVMKDEDGNTLRDKDGHVIRGYSFTDKDLTADTKYKYRMKVRTAKLPGESIFSPVIEARTDVGTKPDISLSTDELTIYPDSTYNIKAVLADTENYQSNISYQWQKFNTQKRKWEDIEGCDKQLLHFYNCDPKDVGTYRCRVNLVRKVESHPQYITTFTESCDVSFSLRSVKFKDLQVFDGEGHSKTNTGLYVNISNTSNASLEKPTGVVIFDILGPNGTIKVAGNIDEQTGDVTINSIEDRIEDLGTNSFVDGGYLITYYYDGSTIFYPSKNEEEYHYLRNIDEDIFLSLKSSYYFGEDITETMGLFDYKSTISGQLTRSDLTDKISKIKFYKVDESGEQKDGEAIKTYELSEDTKKIPVPLNKELARKAYVEAYMDGVDEPVAGKVIQTRKVPIEIRIKNKTTGTGQLLEFLDADDIEISNDIDLKEKNIDTTYFGMKSLAQFLRFKYYEQNGDFICNSEDLDSHKNEFIPASYNVAVEYRPIYINEIQDGETGEWRVEKETDPSYFYTTTFKGGKMMIVGNYYLLSAGPEDKSTGRVRMISPDKKTDFTEEGYVGGTKIVLKAEPNPGYEISKWVVDDCGSMKTYPGTENFTFTVRSQNTEGDGIVNIIAEMKPKDNRIKIDKVGAGQVYVEPEIDSGDNVLTGTKLKFKAVPEKGWRFEEWHWTSLGGDNIISEGVTDEEGNNTKEFTMPDSSAEVYALFARDTVDVMVSDGLEVLYVNNGGDPYHEVGELVKTEKGKNVPKGAEVIVRTKLGTVLAPETNFAVSLTGEEGIFIPVVVDLTMSQGRDACSFILDPDAETCMVYAETAKGVFTVDADTENVEFQISVDGVEMEDATVEGIVSGSQVDIKARATERGKRISGWVINGEEKHTSDTLYTCNIKENMSVAVKTEETDKYTMNASAEGGGTLEYIVSDSEGYEWPKEYVGPDDHEYEATVYKDESILFRSTEEDDGYTLTSIEINGEKQELDEGTYRINQVDGDIDVNARFSPNTYYSAVIDKNFRYQDSMLLDNSGGEIDNGEIVPVAKNREYTFSLVIPNTNAPYVRVVAPDAEPEDYAESECLTPYETEPYGQDMTLYRYRTAAVTEDVKIVAADHETMYITDEEKLIRYFANVASSGSLERPFDQPDGILLRDMDMSRTSKLIFPIPNMHARFDGNGYTIKNASMHDAYGQALTNFHGVFGTVCEEAEIKNVTFENLRVDQDKSYTAYKTGALSEINYGVISRVTIKDSTFNVIHGGSGSGTDIMAAGLAYENQGRIEYCMVSGLTLITNRDSDAGTAGVVFNQREGEEGKASMEGCFFENLTLRKNGSSTPYAAAKNIVAYNDYEHKGTFTKNYYRQPFDADDPNGISAYGDSTSSYDPDAAMIDPLDAESARKLAYKMNKGIGRSIYGVSTDPEDSDIYLLNRKTETRKYVAPLKVEYVSGKKVITYIIPGQTVLPGEETFEEKTPKAWETGTKAYLPGAAINIQNDMRLVGLADDDFGEYTVILSYVNDEGESVGTIYYKDVNEAINDAAEHTSLFSRQELEIIGDAKLSGDSYSISNKTTVTVRDGAALTISNGLQINNRGIIVCDPGSTVHKYGSLLNEGSISILEGADFYNYGSAFNNRGVVTGRTNITCKPHMYGEWEYADVPDEHGSWIRTRTCTVCEHDDSQEVPPDPSEEEIEHIEISSEPEKTVYEVGEKFSDTGLAVTAVLKDGTRAAITQYDLALKLDGEDEQEIKNDDVMDTEGTGKVIVRYGALSTEYEIMVMNTAELLTLLGPGGEPVTENEMEPGNVVILTASLKQKLSYKTKFVWETTDSSIVSITPDETGAKCEVTAVEPGKATVTVYVADENGDPIQAIKARTVDIDVVSHITDMEMVDRDIEIDKGDSYEVGISVIPENTTDKIEWTSSDEDVATVDENGVVTGMGGGKAVITATAPNGMTDSCEVYVNEKAVDLTVEPDEITMHEGDFDVISARVSNVRANGEVVWTVSDPEKAAFYVWNEETREMETVDTVTTRLSSDGTEASDSYILIVGLSFGETTVTASTESESGEIIEDTCEIKVRTSDKYVYITHNDKRISGEELRLDLAGRYIQLGAVSSEEEDDAFKWTVIDNKADPVIKVDDTGMVTFRRTGTAAVKVTSERTDESDICLITVIRRPEGVVLSEDEVSLRVGRTRRLIAELLPEGAEGNVIWISSDENIATVSKDGVITAVAEGETTITAVPDNEGAEPAECKVIVTGKQNTKLTLILSDDTFTYDGKKKLPKVTVMSGDTVLGEDLTKSNDKVIIMFYDAGSKAPGTYRVAAIAREWFYGSGEASYKITVKPTTIRKPSRGKKKFTARWKKLSKKYAKGYKIRYSLKKNMKGSKTKTVKSWKKSKLAIKNLKGGKKYYVQVRTYVQCNGVKYYSKWSKTKTVKTKK